MTWSPSAILVADSERREERSRRILLLLLILVPSLAKGGSIISHFGRNAPKQAAKSPVHMALVTKPRFMRDISARVVGPAQCARRPLDAEPGGRFHRPFTGSLSIRGPEPGGVASHLQGQIANSQGRVIAKPSMNHIDPARSLAHSLGVNPLNKPSESSAKTIFVRV